MPDTPAQIDALRPLLRQFLWQNRGPIALALLCMVGAAVAELLAPWPLKLIFDYVLLAKPLPASLAWLSGLWQFGQPYTTLLLSAGILLIALLSGVTAYFQQALTSSLGYQLVYRLRNELFAHLQQLSLSFHNRSRTGELLSKITGETEAFKDVLIEAVLTALPQMLTIAGMFAILLWLDWRLSLVVLATFPLLFLALARVYRQIKISTRKQRQREGQIAARMSEVLSAVRLVKAYGREAYEQERFEQASNLTVAEGIRLERLAAGAARAVELIKALGLWATVLYGTLRVLNGQLTPGSLLIFIAYLTDMYKPLRNLAKTSTRLSRAVVSMQRISEILATEPEQWPARATKTDSLTSKQHLRGAIEFDRVSFAYAGGQPVLQDVSFRIAPGQRVALVGASGAGKSTVANLILRFYQATQGTIRLDGIDIDEYARATLRNEIGVVLQDALLFGASLRENIAYGKPDATREEIEAAARQAYAHEFINALPDGYDTIIGERGSTLSGGQRQRLCLARAIIKQPALLILDEPTSAIDAESAALIHAAVDRLFAGKTTLVIAHHLATLAEFELILVLQNGKLVEQGTYAELLAQRGEFARLFEHQNEL